jgi:hypothetical protein
MVIHDSLHNDPRHWWYNWKTGEVENGPKSIGSDRYGPYFSEAEAHRALAILQQRSSEWAAEEAAEEKQR